MNYHGLLLDDTHPPASEAALAALERQLGAALPADYRTFLATCNGAGVDYEVEVRFADGGSEYLSFSTLFGLDDGEQWESNPFEWQQARTQPDFPAQAVLPIGRDGGASQLLLDLRDGGQRVIALVAGLPSWTGHRQQDECVVLADTFDAYLGLLHLPDSRVEEHIATFEVSPSSAAATLDWLDSGNPGWRERFAAQWNARVPFLPV